MSTDVTKSVVVNPAKIKELRHAKGYSISDMAMLLGYKTPTGYWLVEKGSRQVSIDVLYTLASIFECSMEDLLITDKQ